MTVAAEHSWNGFAVDEDGFQYKGRRFSFPAVRSLQFCWDAPPSAAGHGPVTRPRSKATLTIRLRGRQRVIRLRFDGHRHGSSVADARRNARRLFDVYDMLARFSFEYRIGKYIEQLDRRGCFVYDGKRFYPDGTVIDGRKRTNLFHHEVSKRSGVIVIAVPASRRRGGMLGRFVPRDPNIYIHVASDEDCLYGLLRSIYGIFWR